MAKKKPSSKEKVQDRTSAEYLAGQEAEAAGGDYRADICPYPRGSPDGMITAWWNGFLDARMKRKFGELYEV